MEDAQIVKLYWERNPEAIARSREKYGIYCFSLADRIVTSREDAEECVNDTWLHAWNSMPPHRPSALRIFLAKITRRVALNRWKAASAQKRGGGQLPLVLDELSECVSGQEDAEGAVETRELRRLLDQFIRELPAREGNIFLRRYFFTEPVGEIARQWGLTENHVSVLLSRTRKKLKLLLEKEGYL